MEINGHTLTEWQRCKRLTLIDRTHKFSKWHPNSLLHMCLRFAIFKLSRGEDKDKVTSASVNFYLATARNPGLDVYGIDPYILAMDHCAIIKNVIEYISRLTLLTIHELPPQSLSRNLSWRFLSYPDDSGTLHRWEFVDFIPEDNYSVAHSWEVFGDIAAANMPMELHIVGLGRRKQAHHNSPWCRIYAHPKLANVYRFQKVGGGKLEGEWKPAWFASNPKNNSKDWVDMMMKDNATDGLIRHISMKEVSEETRDQFYREVLLEGEMMHSAVKGKVDPKQMPMSRYACDHPYACPHQLYCYTSNLTLDNAGMYTPKEVDHAGSNEVLSRD